MRALTTRLMRIKRYSRDQLARLHAAENRQDKIFKAWLADPKKQGSSPRDYWAQGEALMRRFEDDLGHFWDPRKTGDEKELEIKRFEKYVWPVCSKHGARSMDDVPECEATHAIDDEVWRLSYRVNTSSGLKAVSKLSAFIGEEGEQGPEAVAGGERP